MFLLKTLLCLPLSVKSKVSSPPPPEASNTFFGLTLSLTTFLYLIQLVWPSALEPSMRFTIPNLPIPPLASGLYYFQG